MSRSLCWLVVTTLLSGGGGSGVNGEERVTGGGGYEAPGKSLVDVRMMIKVSGDCSDGRVFGLSSSGRAGRDAHRAAAAAGNQSNYRRCRRRPPSRRSTAAANSRLRARRSNKQRLRASRPQRANLQRCESIKRAPLVVFGVKPLKAPIVFGALKADRRPIVNGAPSDMAYQLTRIFAPPTRNDLNRLFYLPADVGSSQKYLHNCVTRHTSPDCAPNGR